MLTHQQKRELAQEWQKLVSEMEKATNRNETSIAHSYENSIARIEDKMQREDMDPKDWL